jgi:hypothetical protein
MLELAELLGLLVAGQHFMHRSGRKADLLEQRGERIAFGDDTSLWLGAFFSSATETTGAALVQLPRFPGSLLRCFDLRERRSYRLICGLSGVSSVLILCQLFSRAFQFKT